jgi:hypothetical protein
MTDIYADLKEALDMPAIGINRPRTGKHPALGMAYGAPSMRDETPTTLAALVAQQTADAAKELEHIKHQLSNVEAHSEQQSIRINELLTELGEERIKREVLVRSYARTMAAVHTMRAATDELINLEKSAVAESQ